MNFHSDNSDTARYQRGLHAYASQFHITPEQVPGWFADAVGDRLGEEAIQSAANAWTDDELSLRDRALRRNRRRGNLESAESEHLRCRIACAHFDDGQASVVTRPSLAQIARSETARFERAGGEIDRHDRRQSLRDRIRPACFRSGRCECVCR